MFVLCYFLHFVYIIILGTAGRECTLIFVYSKLKTKIEINQVSVVVYQRLQFLMHVFCLLSISHIFNTYKKLRFFHIDLHRSNWLHFNVNFSTVCIRITALVIMIQQKISVLCFG